MPDISKQNGKTAIVTGSARGIGAAVAERLAHDGFAVVVNYAGSAADAEAVAAKIKSASGRAIAVQADVADPAAVARLFDEATSAFGGVDVLVNNAGVMLLSTFAETEDALFDRQVAINLKGVFNGMREAARRLREGGRISASPPASLGSISRPTAPMPRPRVASRP
jgi:3-oxoacyl-[acyl-carrier protein] reductase